MSRQIIHEALTRAWWIAGKVNRGKTGGWFEKKNPVTLKSRFWCAFKRDVQSEQMTFVGISASEGLVSFGANPAIKDIEF